MSQSQNYKNNKRYDDLETTIRIEYITTKI